MKKTKSGNSLDDNRNGHASSGSDAASLHFVVWLADLAKAWEEGGDAAAGLCRQALPKQMGPFKLHALLGCGSYGAVFLALDTELERYVALKVAWPHIMYNAVSSSRFVNEPKTVASLSHPGIVQVFRSGWVDSICYIALEFIDGPTLDQWRKTQVHVPTQAAAQIVCRVAEAIEFAHSNSVIHRDLKPSNILLRKIVAPRAFSYEPVVTDFGLARDHRDPLRKDATAAHAIVGSDQYMSPEQAGGALNRLGPTSDVFSLGVILYELLAGRCPFDGETVDEVHQRTRHEEPPPISALRHGIPRDLETILTKCLEKAPSRRYASAGALADDLQRFLNHEPIRARRSASWQRAWKYAQRKPQVVALWSLAVVSLLSIAGLVGAWLADRSAATERIASAKAAAEVAEGIERQHRYLTSIRHAGEALRRGNRAETFGFLDEARSYASAPVRQGMEWGLIRALAGDAERTVDAAANIHAVRFSPNGEYLASAIADGTITLWHVPDWSKVWEATGGDESASDLAFSYDGELLAAVGDDGCLAVYTVADGKVVFKQQLEAGRLFTVTAVGHTPCFAVGGERAVVTIVDALSGEVRRREPLQPGSQVARSEIVNANEIVNLHYVPDREQIAVLKSPPELVLVDVASLALVDRWAGVDGCGVMCVVSSDEDYVAVGGSPGIQLYRLADHKVVATLPVGNIVSSLRFSPETNTLTAGLWDGSAHTWSLRSILHGDSAPGRRIHAHAGRTLSTDLSPDGQWLASGGTDHRLRLWHSPLGDDASFTSLAGRPALVRFSPCGQWLVVGLESEEATAQAAVIRVRQGRVAWSSELLGSTNSSGGWLRTEFIAIAPDGETIATVEADGVVRERQLSSGDIVRDYEPACPRGLGVWYSPDGQNLIVRPASGRPADARLIDRKTGSVIADLPFGRTFLGTFSTPMGEVWIDTDGSRHCFLRRGFNIPPLMSVPTGERAKRATLSSDGKFLAAAEATGNVWLWDLEGDHRPAKLLGHEHGVVDLFFSKRGANLVSQGIDQVLRIWHVPTRSDLLSFGNSEERVVATALSPDERMFVVGIDRNHQFGLRLFRLDTEQDAMPSRLEIDLANQAEPPR